MIGQNAHGDQPVARRGKVIPGWRLPALPGESEAQTWERRNFVYFNQQLAATTDWFARVAAPVEVAGKRVLDFGCGHGAVAVYAAQMGAADVVGLDLDEARIDFAQRNLEAFYPELAGKVRYVAKDIADLEGQFDLILSKDSFEHVSGLDVVLGHMHRLLAGNGLMATGFGPLFYSPFGDHGRYELKVPWLHAVLPPALANAWISRRTGERVKDATDLGLNRLTPQELRALMTGQPWTDVEIRFNCGSRRILRLFDMLRRVRPLERFFTQSAVVRAHKADVV